MSTSPARLLIMWVCDGASRGWIPEGAPKWVILTQRVHPFPFRTRKLSSAVPKILVWRRTGKIGHCSHITDRPQGYACERQLLWQLSGQGVGDINAEGPPVPIPNTEVKLCSAENTYLATDRENRSLPTYYEGNNIFVSLVIVNLNIPP